MVAPSPFLRTTSGMGVVRGDVDCVVTVVVVFVFTAVC
jgi:hypothetical protein